MNHLKPKRIVICLALIGASTLLSSAQAALLFSQYVDGNDNKKGLEIYNPDPNTVNLAEYEIRQYPNGESTPNLTVKLTGSLSTQSKHLVGHSYLKTALGETVNQVANLAFNGDDAIVLYHNGIAIDRFGRVGDQPANGWANISKGNSFKRRVLTNTNSSIDSTTAFDLLASWEKWSERNAFSNYLTLTSQPQPPLTSVSCSTASTPIADLQTATQNQQYVVRGVITADYRYDNGFSGFYVQTADSQSKPNLSNAIFVYLPAASQIKGGTVGDEVILRGNLTTFENQLRIDQLSSEITTCNTNAGSTVTATPLQLPFDGLTNTTGHVPKRYQGMWVKLPQTLAVSENYNFGRYGQLSLSLGRLYIPTNLFPAKSAEAQALALSNLNSKIELDDGYSNQNRTPWLPVGFNASNSLRSGYQLKNVEGILEYRFGAWRIQPILNKAQPEIVKETNPRNNIIQKESKQIRVAAFNVLNYDNAVVNGLKSERGANTVSEFNRQHAKIISALKAIDADVYGLMEIANNGYDEKSALAYLTKALGSDWKYVIPPKQNKLGTDVIAVAIIYNSKRVKPVNDAAIFDDGTELNRVTMAQTFQPLSGGKQFTIVPNHLKSKGSCPKDSTSNDADQKDGQGCWNATRLNAVNKITQWAATNPTKAAQPNYLFVGDLNSYAKEDPILAFEKAKYKVLLNDEKVGQGKNAYSYVFGVASDTNGFGGAGNLDHAIADENLYAHVKRAFAWHINADEPTALDYNEEFKAPEQITAFYADDAYRSSDHDPIIVDLDLNNTVITTPESNSKSGGGSTTLFTLLGLFALLLVRQKWFRT
mgnify:FL=1